MTRETLSARYYAARIEADRKDARTQLILAAGYAALVLAALVGGAL